MNEKLLTDILGIHKKLFAIIALFLLIISLLPIIIYAYFFHNSNLGGPSEFANFATYFSGMVMPLLTFISVMAIALTLYLQGRALIDQKNQFLEQQRLEHLHRYVTRFEYQLEQYEKLARSPIGYQKDGLVLKNYHFNDPNAPETQKVANKINSIHELMSKSVLKMTYTERLEKMFYQRLKIAAEDACTTLNFSYKFAQKDDFLFLEELNFRAKATIFELENWEIITVQELERLLKLIMIPEKLRNDIFETQSE